MAAAEGALAGSAAAARVLEQRRISWNRFRDSNPMKLLSILSWSEIAEAASRPARWRVEANTKRLSEARAF